MEISEEGKELLESWYRVKNSLPSRDPNPQPYQLSQEEASSFTAFQSWQDNPTDVFWAIAR